MFTNFGLLKAAIAELPKAEPYETTCEGCGIVMMSDEGILAQDCWNDTLKGPKYHYCSQECLDKD